MRMGFSKQRDSIIPKNYNKALSGKIPSIYSYKKYIFSIIIKLQTIFILTENAKEHKEKFYKQLFFFNRKIS